MIMRAGFILAVGTLVIAYVLDGGWVEAGVITGIALVIYGWVQWMDFSAW